MSTTTATATSRQRLRELLATLTATVAGRSPRDGGRLMRAALTALGVEALAIVKEAFLVKARGGTDAAGLAWEPLSPKTVAYNRRHPGKRKGKGKRPTLTKAQDALWRRLYAGVLAARLREGDDPGTAAAVAAGHAWRVLKAQGAQTVLQKYGGAKVEINRDTGRLLASLSPGTRDNVLEVGQGTVGVGTNVEYAPFVHARRPLWAEPGRWPEEWLSRLADVLSAAIAAYLRREVR